MVYETIKYTNREQAAEALRKVIQHKRKWVEKTERELKNHPVQ